MASGRESEDVTCRLTVEHTNGTAGSIHMYSEHERFWQFGAMVLFAFGFCCSVFGDHYRIELLPIDFYTAMPTL